MTKIPIIAGNWKMYKTSEEAKILASDLKNRLAQVSGVKIVLCPPFTALPTVYSIIKDSNLQLGAQNMHWEKEGAFTGEVSAEMLLAVGCRYVILGHSERRTYFSEDNQMINKKVKSAVKSGLIPIICVGEKLKEREKGNTENVVKEHVSGAFQGLSKENATKTVIAYEPVWAIGTGKTATSKQANDVHIFIRQLLSEIYDQKTAQDINVLYGGSVKPENSKELLAQSDIDGALVGGASLDADSFEKIVKSTS
ncbi:MAG: triose-phosphate isomerase [candidate division Zixibacteria bacterium]|nr:triose-phosphate isomerase [candidate division Zixibacteria bacterium]